MVIDGSAELLLRQMAKSDPLRREVQDIRKASGRAASLARQFLASSRRRTPEIQEVEINDLVVSMSRMLRRTVGEDVELVTALHPALWSVRADPVQLEEVIMNLVINSRDAMPQGGRIEIATTNLSWHESLRYGNEGLNPGACVLLTVRDTGCGIADAVKPRLFDPLFTTREASGGTGMGLWMVRTIIEQNDGHIWAESDPGRGAAFRISLPRCW